MCGRYALAYDSNELPLAFAQWDINIELNGNNDGDNSVQGDTARGESSDRADLAASEETEHTGEVQAVLQLCFIWSHLMWHQLPWLPFIPITKRGKPTT